jgi:YaiO family outer membrane protein
MRIKKALLLLALIFTAKLFSQDSTSADGLFQSAKKAAFNNRDYPKAIALSKQALLIAPKYSDIHIFLGRLYTWSNFYDSAKSTFEYVLSYSPDNEDASSAYTDLEYWNNHNQAALKVVNNGLRYHPASELLLLKKAKVLFALRSFKESAEIVNHILEINKNNTEARALAERIKEAVAKNSIGVSYSFTTFDKQFSDPWHIASIDYGRQTKLGSLNFRLNYANRFKQNGVQLETDLYPRINKTFYSYLSFGYSDNAGVFPKYRGGLSLYANLPRSFEAEVGTRYLYFSSSTWIYTFYLGKYYKNFLFGARTYLTPSSSTISQSYNVMARYYYGGNADDYFNINIGTGISPDERESAFLLNSSYKLKSTKASIDWKKSLNRLNIFGASAGWINQEYQPKTTGTQLDFGISYKRRF